MHLNLYCLKLCLSSNGSMAYFLRSSLALQAFLTNLKVLNVQLIVREIESYASLARTSQVFLTTNANGLTSDPKLMSQEHKRF